MFFTLRYMRPANTLAVSTCTEPLQLLSALLACTPQQQPSSPCNGKGKYISYNHVTSFLIVTCWSVGGREGVRKGVREGDKETLSFATQLPLEAGYTCKFIVDDELHSGGGRGGRGQGGKRWEVRKT